MPDDDQIQLVQVLTHHEHAHLKLQVTAAERTLPDGGKTPCVLIERRFRLPDGSISVPIRIALSAAEAGSVAAALGAWGKNIDGS